MFLLLLIATCLATNSWVFTEQYSNGTNGPAFSSGSWVPRNLTTSSGYGVGTSVLKVQLGTSPAGSMQLLFQPGIYSIFANGLVNCVYGTYHAIRIFDITTNTSLIFGTPTFDSVGDSQLNSIAVGIISFVSTNHIIELQDQQAYGGGCIFGNALGIGQPEVYAQVLITELL